MKIISYDRYNIYKTGYNNIYFNKYGTWEKEATVTNKHKIQLLSYASL